MKIKKTVSALIIILALCVTSLVSCGSTFRYANAKQYTKGGATLNAQVEDLEIEWIAGKVKIAYHTENTVKFSEESDKALNDNNSLYYWLDGKTLHIKFARSGRGNYLNVGKTLTLYLPAGVTIRYAGIETVSADVEIGAVAFNNADIETVSGDVSVKAASFASKAEISTTSGDINAAISSTTNELDIESTSGDVTVISDGITKLDVDTTSGRVDIDVKKAPRSLDIETVSGAITLNIPDGSGFTAEVSKVSGSFNCDFSAEHRGGKYIYGDGSCDYSFESVSGNIAIKKR